MSSCDLGSSCPFRNSRYRLLSQELSLGCRFARMMSNSVSYFLLCHGWHDKHDLVGLKLVISWEPESELRWHREVIMLAHVTPESCWCKMLHYITGIQKRVIKLASWTTISHTFSDLIVMLDFTTMQKNSKSKNVHVYHKSDDKAVHLAILS